MRPASQQNGYRKSWKKQINSGDIREIFDEIEISSVMENLWKTYQKNYSYAADISWHAIMKSICTLYGSIERRQRSYSTGVF